MSGEKFTFTVDGIEIEAAKGQSIIQACDAAGSIFRGFATTRTWSRPGIAGSARARSTAAAAAPALCLQRLAWSWKATRRS